MGEKVIAAYVTATSRIPDFFGKIQRGTAPSRFTVEFLENLGFKAKADRQLIPLLKALRFLDESNAPTEVYRSYLDEGRSKTVLGRQVLTAYEGLFELDRRANDATSNELRGKFKSLLNVSEQVATWMAATFLKLCSIADLNTVGPSIHEKATAEHKAKTRELPPSPPLPPPETPPSLSNLSLAYRFEIHLPNTTDVEVYRAIFKALREHLRD